MLSQINEQKHPDVSQWHPAHSGSIDIRIDSEGHWFHEGSLITRTGLVKLFASILTVENNQYFIKTPVEKMAIQVSQAPFVIVCAECAQGRWFLTNNLDQVEELTPESDLNFTKLDYPFVRWQKHLTARINQNVMYELLMHASESGSIKDGVCYLKSGTSQIAVGRF